MDMRNAVPLQPGHQWDVIVCTEAAWERLKQEAGVTTEKDTAGTLYGFPVHVASREFAALIAYQFQADGKRVAFLDV